MSTTTHFPRVTAVFVNHEQARQAIFALRDAGFEESQIGLASPQADAEHVHEVAEHVGDSYAGEGALTGVATGVGIGALWGLGILAGAIPAIGPAIAGGTLAVLLSSAAAGAAAAGVAGALVGMGIPKEEAEYYESEIIAGNTILTVDAEDRSTEARTILEQFGGRDMASRVAASMQTHDHGEPPIAPPDAATAAASTGQRHLDFTSSLPTSPNAAREELSGFATQPVSTPVPAATPDHTTFEVPVERTHLAENATSSISEEANMPPKSPVDVPVAEEHLGIEKLPDR